MKKEKTKILSLLFGFCLLTFTFSFSQNKLETQHNLAVQYYNSGEFEKAAELFESLFKKTQSEEHYEFLLTSLIQSKNYKVAEKTVVKVTKENAENPLFYIDLGFVYTAMNDEKKALKNFDKALSVLPANNQLIILTANRFIKRKQSEYAIQCYYKGRKLVHNDYPFSFEIAEIYKSQNKFQEAITEILYVLEYGENYVSEVQNALINTVGEDENGTRKKVLKEILLTKVQENPSKDLYLELLIWELIQEKEFFAAFVQTKALDKRKKEEGHRLLNLSELALANEDYETALKCLKYVIEKGESSMYFRSSKMLFLKVLHQKITTQPNYSNTDLQELNQAYANTLKELGKNNLTIETIKEYAHLQAFYLHEPLNAIALLTEAISITRATPQQLAMCKLELGDVYLITNKIWDASLLYSQVELDFKYDIIGQDAKYRNAKISYYTGDFKWAKAQLDVLKAATDRFISNDAMYLSIVITDNTLTDTITTPLELFSHADLLAFQNQDSLCLLSLDTLENQFKSRYNLMDDVYFLRAKIALKKQQWENAAAYLQKTYEYKDLLADDALFKLAELYEHVIKDKEKAKSKYEEILFKFPGSIYTEEARKRFRNLRGDKEF